MTAQILACNNGGSNTDCSNSQDFCNRNVFAPLAGKWNVYYVPVARPDAYPPPLDFYLHSSAVTFKIGAQSTWQETNRDVYNDFTATGDWMRSSLPDLEEVINAGVRTCIYAGDADYIVNHIGVEDMVRLPHSHTFLLASHTDFVGRLAS